MDARLAAPSDRPPAAPAPTLTLAEAVAAIEAGRVRLLTSDVFDTLVWRPVAEPDHLFRTIAAAARGRGWLADWVDDGTFRLGRVRAEQLARRETMVAREAPECTLEEIWERLPTAFWVGPAAGGAHRTLGRDLELEVERDELRLHRGGPRLLDAARRAGVPVVLVSDTYFSVDQLGSLLTAAGLDLTGVDIVTSSSRRRGKWDGLLDEVLAERGGPAGALHVGDNPAADVEVGRRAGAEVCHVGVHARDDAVVAAHEPWLRLSTASGSDAGRNAAVRETLVAAGELGRDPSYQFGVAVAGPIMAGFAGWVSATAERFGAGAIHCLLREGGRIAELIDIVRPDGPPRVLVHASRWAVMRAAVIDGTPDELERALARRTDLRADHVTEAFGCDADEVARVLGGRVVPRSERLRAYRALSEHAGLREQIVAASARQRRNVVAYLDRTLQLDDGPLVLCDIGWGGTIQEGLTDILRAGGDDRDVIGLYALLSPPGELRSGGGARLLGYLPTVGVAGHSVPHARSAARHPEFLERINTPALGTLLEFGDDGSPVTRPDDHDVIGDSLRLAQQGVLDLCRTVADLVLADPRRHAEWFGDEHVAAAALEGLAAVIEAPDPRLAAALGTWQHDDVAGTAAEALSSDGFRRWVPYANAVDAAEITMHEVFWVPGVASAARSALAHQLEALAAGAHPDTICPPSPTGTARIAVFEPGSALASAQTELVPRLGSGGWMLLQLTTPVSGLRSIRIDAGEVDLIGDVGDASIVLHTADGEVVLVDGAAGLRAAGRWLGGRWLGARRAVVVAGGHLLVDLPADLAPRVEAVAVSVGLRTWEIDAATRHELLPRWRSAIAPVQQRVGRATRRVLTRATGG